MDLAGADGIHRRLVDVDPEDWCPLVASMEAVGRPM